MLLPLLWLYYITFWSVSKTYFSTPSEVVAKFFFAACGGKEGEGARTPRAPAKAASLLQPRFHARVMRQGASCWRRRLNRYLATLLSHQGDAAGYEPRPCVVSTEPCNPAFTPG